jgi:hypothetical protein
MLQALDEHEVGVRPRDQPGVVQLLPREVRTRILLAAGGDVGVADDALGLDVMALLDVAHQCDDLVDLRLRERRIDAAGRAVHIARVDDLDADGRGVQVAVPAPEAGAGMPAAAVLVDQRVADGRVVAHQVVAGHLAAGGQHFQ